MSNLKGKNADGADAYIAASGAGTDLDPYVLRREITVADGANVSLGATTDAAITDDAAGTLLAFIRGLVKILGSAWDPVNGFILSEIPETHYTEDSTTVVHEEILSKTVTFTASGEQELIEAPASGFHLVVKSFSAQLLDNITTVFSLRHATDATNTDYHRYQLDLLHLHTIGKRLEAWPVANASALNVNLTVAAATDGVIVNVEWVVRPDYDGSPD